MSGPKMLGKMAPILIERLLGEAAAALEAGQREAASAALSRIGALAQKDVERGNAAVQELAAATRFAKRLDRGDIARPEIDVWGTWLNAWRRGETPPAPAATPEEAAHAAREAARLSLQTRDTTRAHLLALVAERPWNLAELFALYPVHKRDAVGAEIDALRRERKVLLAGQTLSAAKIAEQAPRSTKPEALTARGLLRHHFSGDYAATIALVFEDSASAVQAQALLRERVQGSTWKLAGNRDMLLFQGGGDLLAHVVALLEGLRTDELKGREAIDSVDHSVDQGPHFDVALPVESKAPRSARPGSPSARPGPPSARPMPPASARPGLASARPPSARPAAVASPSARSPSARPPLPGKSRPPSVRPSSARPAPTPPSSRPAKAPPSSRKAPEGPLVVPLRFFLRGRVGASAPAHVDLAADAIAAKAGELTALVDFWRRDEPQRELRAFVLRALNQHNVLPAGDRRAFVAPVMRKIEELTYAPKPSSRRPVREVSLLHAAERVAEALRAVAPGTQAAVATDGSHVEMKDRHQIILARVDLQPGEGPTIARVAHVHKAGSRSDVERVLARALANLRVLERAAPSAMPSSRRPSSRRPALSALEELGLEPPSSFGFGPAPQSSRRPSSRRPALSALEELDLVPPSSLGFRSAPQSKGRKPQRKN